MKVYTLLYEENSGLRCGADVLVFPEKEIAYQRMVSAYQKIAGILGFTLGADLSFYTGDDTRQCNITKSSACIQNDIDSYNWTIEVHEL